MSEQPPIAEKDAGCICPTDYCLDDVADPNACPVCKRIDPYDPCPAWERAYGPVPAETSVLPPGVGREADR